MRVVYALIWKSTKSEEESGPGNNEFTERIPLVMAWLNDLRTKNRLRGCGGGAFENHGGGLTLISIEGTNEEDALQEALRIRDTNPLNDIGTTELMIWDVFFADLVEHWNVVS